MRPAIRIFGALAALLLSPIAAQATAILPSLTITAAISAVATPTLQAVIGGGLTTPRNLTAQAKFVYGTSGGTTVDAYLQTSLDGGATWIDIANFHFTTASATKIVNLSSATPVTTLATPGDGALASNTAIDGILGPIYRVKYVSTGTYVGATTLQIDIQGARFTPFP
jgi:hypothetical protein